MVNMHKPHSWPDIQLGRPLTTSSESMTRVWTDTRNDSNLNGCCGHTHIEGDMSEASASEPPGALITVIMQRICKEPPSRKCRVGRNHLPLSAPFDAQETQLLLSRFGLGFCIFQIDAFVALYVQEQVFVLVIAFAASLHQVQLRDAVLQRAVDLGIISAR